MSIANPEHGRKRRRIPGTPHAPGLRRTARQYEAAPAVRKSRQAQPRRRQVAQAPRLRDRVSIRHLEGRAPLDRDLHVLARDGKGQARAAGEGYEVDVVARACCSEGVVSLRHDCDDVKRVQHLLRH